MEDDEYVFFLSLHHILIDGWSVEILMSELVQVYNALVKNTHADLPFLSIQYKDYAEWAREETNNETYHAAEKYWIEQFAGEIPSLNMPTSLERPSIQTFNGNIQTAEISSELSDTLRKFCADQDATLFMFLTTLVNVLLHKYSQQNDIIIGTPVSGREHPDLENQIGLFINTLPIRTTLDPQQSFQQLLSQEKRKHFEGV